MPIRRLDAKLEAFWDYDEDDEEWSEDYLLGTLPVTVSNFTVATAEGFLDAVLNDNDLDPAKHYRLAALTSARALRGAAQLAVWRERAASYPDALVLAMVEVALSPRSPSRLERNRGLAERDDTIAVRSLVAAVAQGVFRAILAINRTYQSRRLPKWQRMLLRRFPLQPAHLDSRLEELWNPDPTAAVVRAEALVSDPLDLAEEELGPELTALRSALAERRHVVEPPSTT